MHLLLPIKRTNKTTHFDFQNAMKGAVWLVNPGRLPSWRTQRCPWGSPPTSWISSPAPATSWNWMKAHRSPGRTCHCFFFWNRTKFIRSQWPCHFKFTMHQTKWRFGGTTKTLVHTMTSLNFVNLLAVWDIRFQIHGADKILTNASFSIKST